VWSAHQLQTPSPQPQLYSILLLKRTGWRDGIVDRTRPVVVAGAYESTRLRLGGIQQLPLP